jgi:cytochrome c556
MSDDGLEQDGQDATDDPEQAQDAYDGGMGGDDGNGGGDVDSAFVVPGEKQPLSKGTVAMFVILALAGAGTYFMYVKTGPQSAGAATVDPKAQAVIKQYMSDRTKNPAEMAKMFKDTEMYKLLLNYKVQQVPLSALAANPFRLAPPATDDGKPARISEEEQKRRDEEERVAVLKAVNGLQLQSIMRSDTRRSCMINNTLYQEGQQVEAFTIEKISPSCVVVRNGRYRFELRMQR